MPRLIKARVTLETIYEQIPYLTQQLLASALKMRGELRPAPAASPVAAAAGAEKPAAAAVAVAVKPTVAGAPAAVMAAPEAGDPSAASLLEALEHDVLPFLAARNPRRYRLSETQYAAEFFRQLHLRLAPAYQERADLLAGWCEERRQMELQTRYHALSARLAARPRPGELSLAHPDRLARRRYAVPVLKRAPFP